MNLIAALIILITAAVFFMALKNKSKKAETTDPKPDAGQTAAPAKEDGQAQLETIFNSLAGLNLLIRKDRELSKEIIRELEDIIDDLAAVIPAMVERYPGETLTYEIKKIGKEHLFKTVKEYLDLSAESRENQKEIFAKTIQSLHDVSKRSRDIVEKNETAEFKTMANFLSGKFS